MFGRFRTLVVIVLIVTACGSGGGDDPQAAGEDPTSSTSTGGRIEAEPVEPVEPAEHLPAVTSPVAVFEDTAVYFAEEDARQLVVAVDLAEAALRWQAPSHQHGRILGVTFEPLIDAERGQVVVTSYDADAGGPMELVAYDLDTGEERWRQPSGWAELAPRPCVDGTLLCLPTDAGVEQYRPDGEPVGVVPPGLARSVASAGDLRLTADPHGGDVALVAIGAGTAEARWQAPLTDFTPDAAGYGPSGGWTGDVDEEGGASLFWFGFLPPERAVAGEAIELSPEDRRGQLLAAGFVGLADADGTPLLGLAGVHDCGDLPFGVDELWTCEGLEVVEEAADDDEPVQRLVFDRMVRRSAAEPDGGLVVELPDPVPVFGEGIAATSDPELFVLTPHAEGADAVVLDIATGELAPLDDHPDLVVRCGLPDETGHTYEDDPLGVELRTFEGGRARYATVGRQLGLCATDGDAVEPESALARGPLPGWFGIARDVEDPHGDDDLAATAEGWVVWTETDRLLRIARTDPDPTVTGPD